MGSNIIFCAFRTPKRKKAKLFIYSPVWRANKTKKKRWVNAFNFFGSPITTCPKSATVAVRFFLPVQFNVFFWLATQIED